MVDMNKNTLISSVLIIIAFGALIYFLFSFRDNEIVLTNDPVTTSITYKNDDYGFNFSLPSTWEGYSIVRGVWEENPILSSSTQKGPKLLVRNPKWTALAPYEDIPILVFTLSQWNAYLAENFSVSAAPIKASELGRNNVYVFALPPRWDFDYSLDFKEAHDIIIGNPLRTFNIGVATMSDGKLNINAICDRVTTYMTFTTSKNADTFIADCKEGKHPEVIEKYKVDMNLSDTTAI